MSSLKKELLEVFETVKKSAEAAKLDVAEESRCLDAFKQLKKLPVNMDLLVETQIGKQLRRLTKHPREKIQAVADDLLTIWKKTVLDEKKKDNGNSETKVATVNGETVKSETVRTSDVTMVEKVSRSDTVKVEKSGHGETIKSETVSRSESTFKVEKIERTPKTNGPPKLTSMVKCNDSLRDKVRELLAEAFSRVSNEADEELLDEVNACDPIRVAVSVESILFEKMGRSNGPQKTKFRSIMFNIKDEKNPDLRRKLLLGLVKPAELMTMSPDEMASDERQKENKKIRDKTLFDCERAAAPKASTDQFKCGRCQQRKTTYYQLQTRSADEPMTTFVTCVNCNNHWKFC
ncbi:hypothetical protein ACHQM5_021911 [Ranunculus cassubicifolius]